MSQLESSKSLSSIVSRDGYAARALGVIAAISSAATPSDALELLFEAKTALCAEHAVFATFILGEESHESYRFLLAADARWCLEYQSKAWYGSDPWLLYASMNTETVPASHIAAKTRSQEQVLDLARRYGMVSACIAPAAASGRSERVGMLALGSPQPFFFEAAGFNVLKVLARSLSIELQEWWCRYERRMMIETLNITAEDIDLLKLELSGWGSKEAAQELGSSKSSVNSRWQRLNRKLGSPHRHVTARIAAKYGLI